VFPPTQIVPSGSAVIVTSTARAQPSALGDAVAARRAVVKLPEVRYAYHVAGNYDYILQVEVADLPAYENFHANRLASLPSVAAVTSYVTMKTLSSPPT
jgi:Lrp/AsnC family transcriptional regulator, leucine-responsive regulatory protein